MYEHNEVGRGLIGRFVAVHTYSQGTYVGTLKARHGREVELHGAHRLGSRCRLGNYKTDHQSPRLSVVVLIETTEIIDAAD